MYLRKIKILTSSIFLLLNTFYAQSLLFELTDDTIDIGEETSVGINVNNINDLRAYSVIISYKSKVAKCLGISKGSFLSSVAQTFFLNEIDSASGEITIEEVILIDTSKSGSGELARVNLLGLKDGLVNLSFIKNDFRDSVNKPIPIEIGTATIVVGDTSIINDENLLFTPRNLVISQGFPANIRVRIENVENLNHYSASILYKTNLLNPVDITEEDFLSGSGESTFNFSIDTSAGLINLSSSLNSGVGTTGSGDLAYISFETLSAGTTYLEFTNATAYNVFNQSIDSLNPLNARIDILPNLADTLRINPNLQTINSKDTAEIIVEISNVDSIKSYSIYLSYDPLILDVAKVVQDNFLSEGTPTFFFTKVDTNSGRVQIDEALLGMGSKSGTGNLFRIYFTGEQAGLTTIEFDSVLVSNNHNTGVDIDLINGVVEVKSVVGIVPDENRRTEFTIYQNYPNPFNAGTTIRYSLLNNNNIDIHICDIMGQTIAKETIENNYAGDNYYYWNGKDLTNNECSSGIYFVTISNDIYSKSIKLLLLK